VQYLKKSFSVALGSDAYQKNYEAVFGKKPAEGVKDHVAKGDAATDDTDAVQRAVNKRRKR